MLRIRKKIRKTDIFRLLELPTVVKIEITRAGNRTNLSEDYCYANIYLYGTTKLNETSEAMIELSKTVEDRKQRQYLHSIGAQIKKDEFIKMSNITDLVKLGIGLADVKIPMEYFQLYQCNPDDIYRYLEVFEMRKNKEAI